MSLGDRDQHFELVPKLKAISWQPNKQAKAKNGVGYLAGNESRDVTRSRMGFITMPIEPTALKRTTRHKPWKEPVDKGNGVYHNAELPHDNRAGYGKEQNKYTAHHTRPQYTRQNRCLRH